MIKRISFILACMLTVVLFGCSKGEPSAASSYDPDLNPFEVGALNCEEQYLRSHSDEDLKKLCDQLAFLPWKEKQFREMVLEYYPIFFEKFTPDESFDFYYEKYVYAYKAEDVGGLIPIYNEYKEKASNVYEYAGMVYQYILDLDNITTEEYDFLYDEAYRLYSAARENVEEYPTSEENIEPLKNALSAFGCVYAICEVLGKDVEPSIMEDMEDIAQRLRKQLILDSAGCLQSLAACGREQCRDRYDRRQHERLQ